MTAPQRSSILAAADQLLARRGFRHMTIDDVAREAGIGKGTVYLYFASKEDVALAVIDTHIEATFADLRTLAGSDLPHGERLEKMLVARVVGRADRFRHYTDGLHDLLAAVRPRLLEQRDRQLDAEARIVVGVLRDADGGAATPAMLHKLARALLTGTNAMLPYYLKPDQLGRRSALVAHAEEVARLLVTGALAALGAPWQRTSRVSRRRTMAV